jgi:hypothetical protein
MVGPEGQAGTDDDVEITPDMLAAGEAALARFYGDDGEAKYFLRRAAEEVFLAMVEARRAWRQLA